MFQAKKEERRMGHKALKADFKRICAFVETLDPRFKLINDYVAGNIDLNNHPEMRQMREDLHRDSLGIEPGGIITLQVHPDTLKWLKTRQRKFKILNKLYAIGSEVDWFCQAHGMHHEECPGQGYLYDTDNSSKYVPGIFDKHHVLPVSAGGTDRNDNLIWVNQQCHKLLHANENLAFALGLLERNLERANWRMVQGDPDKAHILFSPGNRSGVYTFCGEDRVKTDHFDNTKLNMPRCQKCRVNYTTKTAEINTRLSS